MLKNFDVFYIHHHQTNVLLTLAYIYRHALLNENKNNLRIIWLADYFQCRAAFSEHADPACGKTP